MSERLVMGAIMAVFGAMLVLGVALRWDWLVGGRKYRRLEESFGPRVPAILYALVGAVLIVFGILNALGRWHGFSSLGTP